MQFINASVCNVNRNICILMNLQIECAGVGLDCNAMRTKSTIAVSPLQPIHTYMVVEHMENNHVYSIFLGMGMNCLF